MRASKTGLENLRSVGEKQARSGFGIWLFEQDAKVAGWVGAMDDFGCGRGLYAQAFCADGDTAIGADFDEGALAPDVGPPDAVGRFAQDRAFFLQGKIPGFRPRVPIRDPSTPSSNSKAPRARLKYFRALWQTSATPAPASLKHRTQSPSNKPNPATGHRF